MLVASVISVVSICTIRSKVSLLRLVAICNAICGRLSLREMAAATSVSSIEGATNMPPARVWLSIQLRLAA
jgi:hypothetical protein